MDVVRFGQKLSSQHPLLFPRSPSFQVYLLSVIVFVSGTALGRVSTPAKDQQQQQQQPASHVFFWHCGKGSGTSESDNLIINTVRNISLSRLLAQGHCWFSQVDAVCFCSFTACSHCFYTFICAGGGLALRFQMPHSCCCRQNTAQK